MSRKRRIATQDIYQKLRRMILDFDLYPGSRVTESELADYFQVSRTPVREALQRLETEGHLEIRPKQGCFIRNVDIHEISQYYDVRVALESMTVELACSNMATSALEKLAATWDPANSEHHVNNPEQIREVEESFHITIAEGSGNMVLAHYLQDVNDHIRIIRRLGFPDAASIIETYEDHYAICQLLLKRDKQAAKNKMVQHIRASQEICHSVTLSQLEQQRKKNVLSL